VATGQQTEGSAGGVVKVTSVEYAKPVANVSSTWQIPALGLVTSINCPVARYQGAPSVEHGPETATLTRSVVLQDRFNVAGTYGIAQLPLQPWTAGVEAVSNLHPTDTIAPAVTSAMADMR
jgi:hypothetical protein